MIDSFDGEYEFLSNFYHFPFIYEGKEYLSSEHAFQAAKMTTLEDHERVRLAATAGHCKKLGRSLPCRKDWDSVKLSVMADILKAKFAIPELREKLLATGSETLVEGNWWQDRFWGVCNGKGENHLGTLLMKVRHELRESDAIRS